MHRKAQKRLYKEFNKELSLIQYDGYDDYTTKIILLVDKAKYYNICIYAINILNKYKSVMNHIITTRYIGSDNIILILTTGFSMRNIDVNLVFSFYTHDEIMAIIYHNENTIMRHNDRNILLTTLIIAIIYENYAFADVMINYLEEHDLRSIPIIYAEFKINYQIRLKQKFYIDRILENDRDFDFRQSLRYNWIMACLPS